VGIDTVESLCRAPSAWGRVRHDLQDTTHGMHFWDYKKSSRTCRIMVAIRRVRKIIAVLVSSTFYYQRTTGHSRWNL